MREFGNASLLSGSVNTSLFDEERMLEATTKLLENQHIFISFFGAQNCGKSTLLNALLGDK